LIQELLELERDSSYLPFESENCFAILEKEFGPFSYGKEKFSEEELFWIGYLYRYWAYTYGESSKRLYKTIGPKSLRNVYLPYHTLDPANAIARLLETRGIVEKDLNVEGLRLMKKIRGGKEEHHVL
jgi:hypothetical protein